MVLSFILAAVIILVDQFSKYLVYGKIFGSVIGDLVWFESTFNTGVAFSMFENKIWLFSAISAVASIAFIILIILKKPITSKAQKICLGVILGGTIGNLIDRIALKGVRDFIYLKFINFAIFNVADMAITFGTIALCCFVLFEDILKKPKKEQKDD